MSTVASDGNGLGGIRFVALLLRAIGVVLVVPSVVLIFGMLGLVGLVDAWGEFWAAQRILELRRSGRNLALAISVVWVGIALLFLPRSDDSVLLFFVVLIRVPILYVLIKHRREFS
ncbi:MAG: hypothetical protein LC722_05870 [Actinobacteria bacterium]|nr:hypothetical protein [Actinomycetota bacterium]